MLPSTGNKSSLRLSRLNSHLLQLGQLGPGEEAAAAAAAAAGPAAVPAAAGTKVRVGMVGLGGRGTGTLGTIERSARLQAKMSVVALADVDPAALQPHKDKGYKLFDSAHELIQSGLIDALLIVTPHYYHTTIGIEALQAGLHVLTEKPISVHKADCEKLIAAYDARPHKSQKFAAMFNNRNNPMYNKVRDMVANGELGTLQRGMFTFQQPYMQLGCIVYTCTDLSNAAAVNWIITTWFRPQAYYDRGGWRGTWAGEGGGVLSNQCPHNLDLLVSILLCAHSVTVSFHASVLVSQQWMLGVMPTTIRSICRLGHTHDIEVEDDVTAVLEYENGASGVFVTTTGEAPGTNRLEIVGTKGRLVAETTGIPTPEDPTGGRKVSSCDLHSKDILEVVVVSGSV